MRVFIAIEIERAIKKALAKLQSEMLNKLDIKKGDLKWVEPESMHLTLKFLGEIADQQLVTVCDITKEVAGLHKSFDIEIGTVGVFGGNSARVLWVGAGEGNDNLLQLQKDLDERLAEAGWPPENRKFEGHMTLCRVKNVHAGVKVAQLAGQYRDLNFGQTPVDTLSILQSELTPKGPLYTLLGDYKLV
jgi:RNA 2',3'-cyclic 3'-phosphodiesterase